MLTVQPRASTRTDRQTDRQTGVHHIIHIHKTTAVLPKKIQTFLLLYVLINNYIIIIAIEIIF